MPLITDLLSYFMGNDGLNILFFFLNVFFISMTFSMSIFLLNYTIICNLYEISKINVQIIFNYWEITIHIKLL